MRYAAATVATAVLTALVVFALFGVPDCPNGIETFGRCASFHTPVI